MKKYYFIFTFTLLIIFSKCNIYSQVFNSDWQWSHPFPQGNDIRFLKMVTASNWVAVGYTGTMMRTTNAGANWMVYTNYFGFYQSFLGQGKNIYGADMLGNNGVAAGTQGYIARTTNAGVTWDSVGSSAGTIALWNASFGDANTVYIGGNSGLVLKSTNAGQTWTNSASPSGNANRTVFALDANTVFTGSTNGTIYKSINGGSSWTPIVTGSTTGIIFGIYFFNANTGIVTGGTNYVRMTTDGGTTWNAPSVSVSATEVRVYGRKNPDELYILGSVSTIYKSTDYGVSWTTIPYQYSGQPVALGSNTMDITGSAIAVGGVNGLLNVSTNSGTSWTGISRVLNSINIYDIAFKPGGKVWAVGNSGTGNNCILFSDNNGESWTVQSTFTGDLRSIWMTDDNNGWVCGQSGKAMKTTNGGQSWENITIPGAGGQTMICTQFINVNTGWVFGSSYPYKTTDGGATWVQGSSNQGAKWASMIDANTGWLISNSISNTLVFKTTDGGTNWVQQSVPNPGNLWRIKMINANTGYICGDQGRLFRTTDGENWTVVTAPTANNYTTTDWTDVDNGVLGAGSGFSAKTSNGGQSWIVKNTGGSAVWRMNMVHPDTVWSVQSFGFIFKYAKGSAPVGITVWENKVPDNFVLKQNYPNPFNPATTIEFSMPRTGNVSLTVYDIKGNLVERIIDNITFNAGTVKHNFDGSKLSSATYFCLLTIDGKLAGTKKMILVK